MHSRHASRLRETITPSSLPGPLMALVGGSCAPQLSSSRSQGQLSFSSDIPSCHVQQCPHFSKTIGVLYGLTHISLDGLSFKRNPRAQDNSPTPHAGPLYTTPKQPSCNQRPCFHHVVQTSSLCMLEYAAHDGRAHTTASEFEAMNLFPQAVRHKLIVLRVTNLAHTVSCYPQF